MLSVRPSAVCVSWETLVCYDPVWLLYCKVFTAPPAAVHCLRVNCWRPDWVVWHVIPVVREWYAAPSQHGQQQCHTLCEPLSKSCWYQTVIVCCHDSVHYFRCWCWRVVWICFQSSLRDVPHSRLLLLSYVETISLSICLFSYSVLSVVCCTIHIRSMFVCLSVSLCVLSHWLWSNVPNYRDALCAEGGRNEATTTHNSNLCLV